MAKFRDEEVKKPKPKKNISTLQSKDVKVRRKKHSITVETAFGLVTLKWWVSC